MFNANTAKSYDFWYYQSLLEEPYTDVVKYFSTLIYERDKYNVITLAEEELEPEGARKHNSSKGVPKHNNYLKK